MKTFTTCDIKLQAFLRSMKPTAFLGIQKTNKHKVFFLFENDEHFQTLINGYYMGKPFTFSPLDFASNIDKAKQLIFQDNTSNHENEKYE